MWLEWNILSMAVNDFPGNIPFTPFEVKIGSIKQNFDSKKSQFGNPRPGNLCCSPEGDCYGFSRFVFYIKNLFTLFV